MYTVINLTDLENDFMNPHDASARINKFFIPEVVLHFALTLIFLFTGRWLLFVVNIPLVVYHAHLWRTNKCYLDVTEIFAVVKIEQKKRLAKMGFYLIMFVFVIYRLVEAAVTLLMSKHGTKIKPLQRGSGMPLSPAQRRERAKAANAAAA
eukprot:CAMPEP_0170145376 /NCGR_PEP_ID=MMETSP0033_2-20121228/19282_1 /TAXON_ID=195969 /ORGANISM="Dolichomastix tenuilepis, Strain CCMP3274" /LENGTH=150 /DNA_ID=CAMNT_0010381945 /DNA_START=57 /DNA_END=509 /DNA_ORIENTATION=+